MAATIQGLNPASTAVENDDLLIPVSPPSTSITLLHQMLRKFKDRLTMSLQLIDFGPFFSGTPSDKHAVALSITNALRTSGFLYLKAHGIPPSVVSKVFASSTRFFDRPQSEKDCLEPTTPQSSHGYVSVRKEQLATLHTTNQTNTKPESIPDLKEIMEIGREGVEGRPNRWPDHLDDKGKEFKEAMLSFFEMCKTLNIQIMRAIALGMNLPEHFFDDFVNQGDNSLRLLHYLPVRKENLQSNTHQVRASEHSDFGSISLRFQDRNAGLQVRTPNGTFIDAFPIADTIVVSAGDLLARWSNDTIKSPRHRVIEPHQMPGVDSEGEASEMYPSRYSVSYLCNPNLDKVIEALPGTYGEDIQVAKKYEEITAGDYLASRLTATA